MTQWITAGLAVDFLVVYLMPSLTATAPPSPVPTQNPVAVAEKLPDIGLDSFSGPVSYAQAVEKAAPAVVNIYTVKHQTDTPVPFADDPFFQSYFGDTLRQLRAPDGTSLGSGVIVGNEGYVLTNNHLVEGADEIQVLLQDARRVSASIVGTDPETDLAVLKIILPDLPTVMIREAADLRVGDVVMAIGNPFGVGQTVTLGIVSATGRNRLGLSTFEDFIQTDAAINPGNSGGALIDATGRLVGINTAIFSRAGGSEGIGFAIPAHLVVKVMSAIVTSGYVPRGWLGAEIGPLPTIVSNDPQLPRTGGILVGNVVPSGPAARAGVVTGDVITHINGTPVSNPHLAVNLVVDTTPGETIYLTLFRSGELHSLQAVVTERPRSS